MWYVNSWARVCHTLKDKDKDKDRDKDKDNETEKRKGGGAMKLYNTDFFASIGVDETHTQIAMTIGGKVVLVKIPNNDVKVEYGDSLRVGDAFADWLAVNAKDVNAKEL